MNLRKIRGPLLGMGFLNFAVVLNLGAKPPFDPTRPFVVGPGSARRAQIGTVLFATDRPYMGEYSAKVFGDREVLGPPTTENLVGGSVAVSTPITHVRGKLERAVPGGNVDGSFYMLADTQTHTNNLADALCPFPGQTEQGLLVYVHGFNNSFETALLQAAQLKADTHWPGAILSADWHSMGDFKGYIENSGEVDAAIPKYAKLWKLLRKCWGTHINFVVHSMGNKLFLNSMQTVRDRHAEVELPPMGRVILAAPDISSMEFTLLGGELLNLFEKVVHYYSSKDNAVKGSELIRLGRKRAGRHPGSVWGIESVCTDNVNSSAVGFGHSYFATSVPVLEDIERILTLPVEELENPDARHSPIRPYPVDKGGGQAWFFTGE